MEKYTYIIQIFNQFKSEEIYNEYKILRDKIKEYLDYNNIEYSMYNFVDTHNIEDSVNEYHLFIHIRTNDNKIRSLEKMCLSENMLLPFDGIFAFKRCIYNDGDISVDFLDFNKYAIFDGKDYIECTEYDLYNTPIEYLEGKLITKVTF